MPISKRLSAPAKAPKESTRTVNPGEIEDFPTREAWERWLGDKHQESAGIWLRFAKKGSGLRSITYQEALEVALCYGWIDGQKKPENERAWLQRFVPRKAGSLWSKINREKALALIANGQMQAAGLHAIELAKQSGRWAAAYDSPSSATTPDDLQAALNQSPKAQAFFETLNRANRYAVVWRIQTTKKAETRARKLQQLVAMLERGETCH